MLRSHHNGKKSAMEFYEIALGMPGNNNNNNNVSIYKTLYIPVIKPAQRHYTKVNVPE